MWDWLKCLFKTEIVTAHGDWFRAYRCHCGAVTRVGPDPVCRDCGCVGRFSGGVFRWEWEQPAGGGTIASILMEGRTRRMVMWQVCTHENEPKG